MEGSFSDGLLASPGGDSSFSDIWIAHKRIQIFVISRNFGGFVTNVDNASDPAMSRPADMLGVLA